MKERLPLALISTVLTVLLPGTALGTTIRVPRSELQLSSQRAPEISAPITLEIAVASRAPRDAGTESRLAGTSTYGRSFPELSVALLSALGLESSVSWKAGVSFLHLSRTGYQSVLGAPQAQSQSLYLLPFSLGAEWSPSALATRTTRWHAGLSLLPTVGIAPRSVLADSETIFGVPLEIAAGSRIRLPIGPELALSLVARAGHVGSFDFLGVGLLAGLRFDLQ